jgi:hypothetical protein
MPKPKGSDSFMLNKIRINIKLNSFCRESIPLHWVDRLQISVPASILSHRKQVSGHWKPIFAALPLLVHNYCNISNQKASHKGNFQLPDFI